MVSPISSTYLAAVYTGRACPLWLSVSQGLYEVGAGIIPLTASRAIYNLGGAGNDLSQVQIYYYIAVGFAGVALLSSLLLNYRHAPDSLQQVKTKTTPQQAGSAALGTR